MARFSSSTLNVFFVGAWLVLWTGCSGPVVAPDAAHDSGAPDTGPQYTPPYACTSDSQCGGAHRCIEGACECEVNAQCNPFGMLMGACADGRCVAMCPYTGSPRETPGAQGCDDPRERACCATGERCCPSVFEVAQCLPGDEPCWPSCPGLGKGVCPPDQLCRGAELSLGLAVACSQAIELGESGIDSRFGCVPRAECPAAQLCGAQTCCAPGTVCLTGDGDLPADGDPGVGLDLVWLARPAGICCIPD